LDFETIAIARRLRCHSHLLTCYRSAEVDDCHMVNFGESFDVKHQPHANLSEPYLLSYRWLMLALLWLLYFSFGTVSGSAAPLVTPMLRDLHMSYGQMGFVLGSWQLTYIAVAVIAGIILDRWGVRRSLFVGTIVIGLSAGLRYFATGFWTLLPFVALFGLGGPMVSVGAPKTISVWFRGKDRGTAVGIYSVAPRMGRMLVLAATNGIVMPLTGYSWRLTFVCYGLLTLGAALFWWALARDAKQVDVAEGLAAQQVLVSLMNVRNVRLLLMAGLLSYTISHGFMNWLPKMLENGGMSPTMAGLAAATPLLVSIPGVILIPPLVPPHLRSWSIGLSALFAAIATMLVASSGVIPAPSRTATAPVLPAEVKESVDFAALLVVV